MVFCLFGVCWGTSSQEEEEDSEEEEEPLETTELLEDMNSASYKQLLGKNFGGNNYWACARLSFFSNHMTGVYAGENWPSSSIALRRLNTLQIADLANVLKPFLVPRDQCAAFRTDKELSKKIFFVLHAILPLLGYEIGNPATCSLIKSGTAFWEQSDRQAYATLCLKVWEMCVFSGFVQITVQMLCHFQNEYLHGRLEKPVYISLRPLLYEPVLEFLVEAWITDSEGNLKYLFENQLLPSLPPCNEFDTPLFTNTGVLPAYGNRDIPICKHGLILTPVNEAAHCQLTSKNKACRC